MPELGNLIVNTFAMSVGMPLEGTVIRVSNNGGSNILAEAITDNSGKSDILELPCPRREYSLEYAENMPKPYAQYNLEIIRDGFRFQRIIGVEIFNGTTAIQNIILTPSNGGNYEAQTIMIEELLIIQLKRLKKM